MDMRRSILPMFALAAASLSACGGGGASPQASSTTTTPSSTTTPAPPAAIVTPAGVAAFTTIYFANVANYAAPTLPAYFDQNVAALDNTPAKNAIDNRVAS